MLSETGEQTMEETIVYESFVPYPFKCTELAEHCDVYDTYSLAVDKYYSEIEAQKVQLERLAKAETVEKTLDKVRNDHAKRIAKLERQEQRFQRSGELILQHTEAVYIL